VLAPSDDRVTAATKQANALLPRLPHLRLRVAGGAPKDAKVQRDGVAVGGATLGVSIPIDPGAHRVVVEAAGRHARAYTVQAAEGERVDLVVDAGELIPDAPRLSSATSTASSRSVAYVFFGAAGAALGVGAVTGLLAIDRNAVMNDHCNAARVCDAEGVSAGRTGRTFDVASTVGFAAAGVLIAGGVVWLVTHSPKTTR
jgi:hypothetical protein